MRRLEKMLQERLERLETGEPPEACLTGLPEDEAELLKLASTLRAMPYPAREVAAQRAQLLNAARNHLLEDRVMTEETRLPEETQVPKEVGKSSRPSWVLPAALAGAGGLVLTFALVAAAVLGIVFQTRSSQDTTKGQDTQFSPGLAAAFETAAPDPKTAVLGDVRGTVEIQAEDGTWTLVADEALVTAGQHIRTTTLSGASLLFFDGSLAGLGPNTELVIDSLNANLSNGPRIVVLNQLSGETVHDVIPFDDGASRYEVHTPSGFGAAQGTSFSVLVSSTLISTFSVDEGVVAVTSLNVTVIVVAGQTTTVDPDSPPDDPQLLITGVGKVTQTGAVWTIAGQTFLTGADTAISGNPQIGDWVAVQGRTLTDGTRFADSITLLSRAPENSFSIMGTVDGMGDAWTISGLAVSVDGNTAIQSGIELGDVVVASGVILEDGTRLAEVISLADDDAAQHFEFSGVVQGMDDVWTISGVAVTIDQNTSIDGSIAEGDVVEVEGWILADGSWLATSIELEDEDELGFEFTGTVESMDPWVVSGIGFDTGDFTEIDGDIEIGSLVEVEGQILEDGTWLADEISLIDEDEDDEEILRFEIVGEAGSIDPWIVSGISIAVDGETEIEEGIEVGDLVRASGVILPDGTLLAEEIALLDEPEFDLGCLNFTSIVSSASDGQIILHNFNTLNLNNLSDAEIDDDITAASVVLITICTDSEDEMTVITIIIIFQLDVLPPLPGGGGDDDDDD